MANHIDRDHSRFRQIVKEARKRGLEKYLSEGDLGGVKPDGKVLRVPIKRITLPRFTYGPNDGVGQGDGDIGDPISGKGDEEGQKGQDAEHAYAELEKEEAGEILSQKLKLPNLLDKFGGNISSKSHNKYTGVRHIGPESLRHFKRTFKEALKRQIGSGEYDPKDPLVLPIREDKRYRSAKENTIPASKAAIIYLLDYSASMEKVLTFMQNVGWWADAWIQHNYKQEVQRRYVQYGSGAKECTFDEFWTVKAAGGTNMSAGLEFTRNVAKDYPEEAYNLYIVHFTDGDCSGLDKDKNALTEFFVPRCNAMFVCEAASPMFGFGPSNEKYSSMLERLIKNDEEAARKIRSKAYTEAEVLEEPVKKMLDTLGYWFK